MRRKPKPLPEPAVPNPPRFWSYRGHLSERRARAEAEVARRWRARDEGSEKP